MPRYKVCRECGVPLLVSRSHTWNPDGTITQRRDPDHRMVLLESDGLGILFSNIEELIGISIEKIIIESKSRATRDYVEKLVRGPKGQLARLVGLRRIINRVVRQGKVLGYGSPSVTEFNWKESVMVGEVTNPYSLPLFCGDFRGSIEAIRKITGTVEYEQLGPCKYRIRAFQAPHLTGIEERLIPRPIPRKPGEIRYTPCPACGLPVQISEFHWDLGRGIITHRETGLRFALLGPVGLQVIFDELESELGDTVPETIVEAQRMRASRIMDLLEAMYREGLSGERLSVMGLGNLVSSEVSEAGYTGRVRNAALPPLIVGTAQAIFDKLSGGRSRVEWSFAEDGDLTFTINPQ